MTTHADNSLETILLRRLKRTITPRVRGLVMGCFREAVEIYRAHEHSALLDADMEKERKPAQNPHKSGETGEKHGGEQAGV